MARRAGSARSVVSGVRYAIVTTAFATWRRLPAFALTLGFALLAISASFAQAGDSVLPASEWAEIRRIVETQLSALRRGDGAGAFAFATRDLRAHFGTHEKFMQMVRAGYQPLIDARYSELLDGAVVDGKTIQPLRLVMHDNTVLVALYFMEKEDDGWHIAGCLLAPSTVKAAWKTRGRTDPG
jgi:hypothetical protein